VRKETWPKSFCTCLALGRLASVPPPLRLMKFRLLFCAMLAILCAQLHAQSTGIYVNSSNNVGIGTTTPASPLTVSTAANVKFELAGGANQNAMLFDSANGGDQFEFYEAAPRFGIWDVTNSADRLVILNNGNVGIGTTNPGTMLEIDQNGTAYNIGLGGWWSGFRTTAQTGLFGFQQNDRACFGLGGNVYNIGFSANAMGIMNGSTTAEDIYLINRNNPGTGFLVLKASGNVGINTSSPGYTLDVAGQVHAASFVASSGNNYADFVFKPGYKLPPLSDIEASIKKEGHLPGIPDETEAKAHGIDLASMQVKLLQKIEELTLHVIDQEKHQIDEEKHQIEQDKRIEQLEKENAELRERVPNE